MDPFQFSLTGGETVHLLHMFNSIETFLDGLPFPYASIKEKLYRQLHPQLFSDPLDGEGSFRSHFHGESCPPSRYCPYPPPTITEQQQHHATAGTDRCPRGARKKYAPRSRRWGQVNEPSLGHEAVAEDYLLKFDLESYLHVETSEWIDVLENTLGMEDLVPPEPTDGTSLGLAIRKCSWEGYRASFQAFHMMLAQMELAVLIDSYVLPFTLQSFQLNLVRLKRQDETLTVIDMYDKERVKANGDLPALKTFQSWNTTGKKYCQLAAGGTLYFLVLILATNKVIQTIKLTESSVQWVANVLRHPPGMISF